MYGLTKEQKIDFIIEKSAELNISAYEFGENTKITATGARNILTRQSENPRNKNLDIMMDYLMSKVTGTNLLKASEPTLVYSKKESIDEQLRIIETAVERIKNLI